MAPGEPAASAARRAAEAFVQAHGLPGSATDDNAPPGDARPLPAVLAELLDRPHPDEAAWWCRIAAGWQEAGWPGLARSSAGRAWELARAGGAASWAELGLIADLLAATDDTAEPADVGGFGLQREPQASKSQRIRLLFGRGDSSAISQRQTDLAATEDLEKLIPCVSGLSGIEWGMLARVWHRTHHDHLVIEQFLARIAGQPLASWLAEGPEAEALVWCGWSFRRIGDPATAHAAFRLALALEEDDEAAPPAGDPNRPPPSEPLTGAREYLARFPDPPTEADVRHHPQPYSAQFARLAHWLEERGLEGYFPLLTNAESGSARVRPSSLRLPFRALAARSGWYPVRQAPVRNGDPLRTAVPPVTPPPVLDVPRQGRRALDWRHPPRLLASQSDGTGTIVPIGVSESGGAAVLRMQPGRPVLLAGVPSGDAVLRALADALARDGWTTLWARQHGAAGGGTSRNRGWHWLGPAASPTDLSDYLLRELAGSSSLRLACRQCLDTMLPAYADPAAKACVEAVTAAPRDKEAREVLLDGGKKSITQLAARLVDRAARLSFAGPRDVRRAAVLLDLTTDALHALRQAVCVGWEVPSRVAAEPVRCAEVGWPDGSEVSAALLTILTAGTLASAAAATTAKARSAPDSPAAAVDFLIEVRRREKRTISEDDIAAAISAANERPAGEHDQPPPPAAPADSGPPIASPWTEHGLVEEGREHRLCLMLTGSLGRCWAPVLEWLRRCGLPVEYVLVSCIPSASELDIGTASHYHTVLAGALPSGQRRLLQISAGIRLAQDQLEDLGKHGAVLVRGGAAADAGRPERLIVRPEPSGRR